MKDCTSRGREEAWITCRDVSFQPDVGEGKGGMENTKLFPMELSLDSLAEVSHSSI